MPPKQKDPPPASPPDSVSDQIAQFNQTMADHTNLVTTFESRLNELTTRMATMDTTQASILRSNQDLNQQFITFQDTIRQDHTSLNQTIDDKFASIIQLLSHQNPQPDLPHSSPSLRPSTTTHRFQHAYDLMQQQQSPSPTHHHTPPPASSTGSLRLMGFHQKESKDFHVSKFLKLLTDDVLNSDSL